MQDVSDKLLGQFVACLEQRLAGEEPAGAAPPSGVPVTASPVHEVAGTPPTDAPPPPPAAPPPPPPPPPQTEALDLGSTVLPVLLKSYWRQAAAVVVVLVLLRWLRRR
jgi:hypothetical protein